VVISAVPETGARYEGSFEDWEDGGISGGIIGAEP